MSKLAPTVPRRTRAMIASTNAIPRRWRLTRRRPLSRHMSLSFAVCEELALGDDAAVRMPRRRDCSIAQTHADRDVPRLRDRCRKRVIQHRTQHIALALG